MLDKIYKLMSYLTHFPPKSKEATESLAAILAVAKENPSLRLDIAKGFYYLTENGNQNAIESAKIALLVMYEEDLIPGISKK